MGLVATFGTAALEVASKTAAMGIGGAMGAFLVLGGAKLFHWLKRRDASSTTPR